MKNDFNQDEVLGRIASLQAERGLSSAAFARMVMIDPANYGRKIRQIQPLTKLDIRKISRNLNISETWLCTGEGVKYDLESKPETETSIPSNAIPSVKVMEYEFIGENKNDGLFFIDQDGVMRISVPHVPYAARAEFPNMAEDLTPHLEEWSREMYIVDKRVRGRYLSFDVAGDSMDNGSRNCLQSGDKVLARELERDFWKDIKTNDHRFWVIVFGSSVLIKEIVNEDLTQGTITCHSLNPSPEYHDFTLNLDEVKALYYVVKVKPKERNV